MQSAAFLLPDTWRSNQEKKSQESYLSTWNGTEISILTAPALSSQRKWRPEPQLEQLGMTKYFLNITFPLEQLLWLSLFFPQMKWEVTHTTNVLWSSHGLWKLALEDPQHRSRRREAERMLDTFFLFWKSFSFQETGKWLDMVSDLWVFPLY